MSTSFKLSIAEYDAMIEGGAFVGIGKKIELFRGELVEMSPAGPVHDDYIAFLTRWSCLSTEPSRVLVRVQSGLSLPELESRPEPDILWVRNRRYLDRHPRNEDVLLVIEVSDSSKEYDRNEKAMLYSQAGIIEFWVVDVQEKKAIAHREPTNLGYSKVDIFNENDVVRPLAEPKAELKIRELFGL